MEDRLMLNNKNLKKVLGISAFAVVAAIIPSFAQETNAISNQVASTTSFMGTALAILGAALATFGGGFGSSIGVGLAGEVGNGVLSEDGNKFGSVLLLQALPMTQSIYGMLVAFLILPKLAGGDIPVDKGLAMLFAALPIAVTGYISGVWQGKVSAASMQLIARKPKQMGQAIILPAMVETFAVFGLLVSILMLGAVK